MPQSDARIALLIDADNAPVSKIETILSEIEKHGIISIRRAYGNWKKDCLKAWADCLPNYAILPVQQFDYIAGKNATDFALTIDAMDLLHTEPLDAFAIVSSDADFTPLVVRMINSSVKVYGFGERKAPSPFVSACSKFFYLESKGSSSENCAAQKTVSGRVDSKILKQDTKLIALLRGAIVGKKDANQWAAMSQVGVYVRQKSLTPGAYGYGSLSSLFEAIDLFEVQRREDGIYVRSKKK